MIVGINFYASIKKIEYKIIILRLDLLHHLLLASLSTFVSLSTAQTLNTLLLVLHGNRKVEAIKKRKTYQELGLECIQPGQ